MIRTCILALLLALSLPAVAGTIRGDVKDAKDSSGVAAVSVAITALNRVASTDISGHFELINLPDGTYEVAFDVTGYKPQKRTVTLTGGGDATIDVLMTSKNNQLRTATVRSSRVTRTESAVVLEIKKSSVAVSGISAAQISKTQDRNAADVVKRIPGVTIQDDRFITIRGLADRYNTVWLNDAGAPSSEVDKKSFSFDLIPSGLIDRILIFKTPAADLPGDFAGGMVKIYTTSMPARTEYNLSVQGSYRSGSTGTDFNAAPSHSGDMLGYDDGSRNLPGVVPNYVFNKNEPGIKGITQAFSNDWIYKTGKQDADMRVSGSASNLFRIGRVKFGNTLGFSYTNTRTNYNVQNYDWVDTTEQYHYNDQESINKVNLAGLENLVATVGNSKFEFRNLYNQVGTSGITARTSIHDSALSTATYTSLKAYQFGYENRKTYTSQLSGTHHNDDDSRKYNWTLGYSSLIRNQPDLRRIQYNEDAYGKYYAQVASTPDVNFGGGRIYSKLDERVYSFSHQFTQKIRIDSGYAFDVSLGNYVEYKKRSFNTRELGYTLDKSGSNFQLLYLPLDQIFAQDNIGEGTNFRIEESTSLYDQYVAKNTLIASFLSVNAPIGNRMKVLAGLRYEDNRQQLESYQNLNKVTPDIKTSFLLPSVNLTYNFTAKMLMRLAYGKTLNRPEFREQAPLYFYDFSLRSGTYGALFFQGATSLEVAQVQNLDARWEFYPGAGELIHAGVFYKSFNNPIIQTLAGGIDGFTYINGRSAYVGGVEVDVRKNLIFLDDKLGTNFLKNFVLVGNLSLAKSELKIDSSAKSNALSTSPLQGQSNTVVNAGLFYQNDSVGILGSVLYNVYSPRVYAVGSSTEGSIGELAFHSLDLSLSKVFAKHYTLTLGVQNLLDDSIRFYQDTNGDNKFDTKNDKPFRTYRPGQYFTVGVKVRF